MNDPISDLRPTIVPRSDQLNADDLLSGPIEVTIEGIQGGNKEQPVILQIDGGHQPYKPGKSMRRILISAWGKNGHEWVGRSMTLYNDPEVVFGGVKVGGIRISHLSHIARGFTIMLTVTRGKKIPFSVTPMPARAPHADAEYLKTHPDKDLVKQIRKELYGTKKPLDAAEIKALAEAVRKHEPPREPGSDDGI